MDFPTFLAAKLDASSLSFKKSLADRLNQVAITFAEDYDGASIAPSSLEALVDYLESSPNPAHPDVTATPAGDLYAEWRSRSGQRLGIEFLASGVARFLVVRSNPKHPRQVDRMTGTTTADALAETLAPLMPVIGLAA